LNFLVIYRLSFKERWKRFTDTIFYRKKADKSQTTQNPNGNESTGDNVGDKIDWDKPPSSPRINAAASTTSNTNVAKEQLQQGVTSNEKESGPAVVKSPSATNTGSLSQPPPEQHSTTPPLPTTSPSSNTTSLIKDNAPSEASKAANVSPETTSTPAQSPHIQKLLNLNTIISQTQEKPQTPSIPQQNAANEPTLQQNEFTSKQQDYGPATVQTRAPETAENILASLNEELNQLDELVERTRNQKLNLS
jgi:hypothetical protein